MSVNELKNRILGKTNQSDGLSGLVSFSREMGCLGDLIGREYEIKSPDGKVLYIVRQKAMKVKDLMILMKCLNEILKKERKTLKKNKGRRR